MSVEPPLKETTLPLFKAANVWFSLVRNTVTASAPSVPGVPSVPSDPSEPGVPSVPDVPPSTLNTFIESVKSSFVTDMVTGNFALSEFKPPALVFAENDKLPLTIPEPSETLVSFKLNPVILVSSAPVIVISLG